LDEEGESRGGKSGGEIEKMRERDARLQRELAIPGGRKRIRRFQEDTKSGSASRTPGEESEISQEDGRAS
jgi:hypothetical protein